MVIARNKEELRGKITREKPKSVTLEDFKRTSLIGTPDECSRKLLPYVDLGVTHFMLFFGDLPSFSSLSLFAESIAEKMR